MEPVKVLNEENVTDLNEELVDLDEEDIISSDLSILESQNEYVLAILEGVFMVIEEDNGNGRWYMRETINEGILKNDYVKKMMASKALIGEPHHPVDRTSIWSDESSISTTKLWIDPTGKYLMGRADILDTPKGRILYTLAKYGTALGVSARANGQGVKQGGHLVIRPEHYFFKTFDVVLNPGFAQARPKILDPTGKSLLPVREECEDAENKMYEEIEQMISNNSCDKKMLKDYIEYCGSEKLKGLLPLVEDASTVPSEGDTSSSIEIGKLNEEIVDLRSKVIQYEKRIMNFTTYRKNVDAEIFGMKQNNDKLSEEIEALNETLESSNGDTVLFGYLEDLREELAQKNEELEESKKIVSLYEEENNNLTRSKEHLSGSNKKLLSKVKNLSESVEDMESTIEDYESPVREELPKKLFEDRIDMFGSGCHAQVIDEEQNSERVAPITNGRVNLIKTLGGK